MERDKNTAGWIFIAVIVVLFFLGNFGMGGYGIMGLGMGFGFPVMLLFWGLFIWLIVTLINAGQSQKNGSDPLTIVKKRYASGEITKKQFEEMKKEMGV